MVKGGVHGLFVLGTTGEGPAFSAKQKEAVVTTALVRGGAVARAGGRHGRGFDGVRGLTDHAAEAGAAATVLASPPYSPTAGPELIHYLDAVRTRPAAGVPLRHPSRTGAVPFEAVRHAMGLDRFVGFKDSSGRMVTLHEVIHERDANRPGFRVLVGPEELLGEAVLLGADGGVAGGANLFPALFVALYDAASAGDLAAVRRLHAAVMEVSTTLYRAGQHGSSFLKSVKGGARGGGASAAGTWRCRTRLPARGPAEGRGADGPGEGGGRRGARGGADVPVTAVAPHPAGPRGGATEADLSVGWTLRCLGAAAPAAVRDARVPADAPASAHTALLAAGLVDEPYRGHAWERTRWIGRSGWSWTRSFDADPAGPPLELELAGVDGPAEVFLNGGRLGRCANGFRPHAFDLGGRLKQHNTLEVRFEPPTDSAVAAAEGPFPIAMPGITPYNGLRKMACGFGWDWAPPLDTCGLSGPVTLRPRDAARIDALSIHTEPADLRG